MSQPIRLDGLTAKIESVYATDAVPVIGTDDVRVAERVWTTLKPQHAFENERPDAATGTLISLFDAPPGGRFVELDIAWDARGPGVIYSATDLPEADPLIRACGLARTDTFPTSVQYDIISTGHESVTIYGYAGSILFKIVGCRGNLVWPVTAGVLGVLRLQMQGLMIADPVDLALPPGFAYDTTLPQPAQAMAMSVGGVWSPDVVTAEANLGSQIERLDSANASEGVAEFAIRGFDPTYTLSAREPTGATPLATYDPYDDKRLRTLRTIDQTLGAVALNQMILDINDARLGPDPEHTENNGFTSWDLVFKCQDMGLIFS